ncbi:methyltransferase domain-containing protein [Halogeometricum borinquense]|uniref:Methyltransferase domain-containing protein n=1 Tax=Halogeometricum borinquense TaxID=60847 RepID=A0A482TG46_9EURY|nr:methyltransferase domain-containing protein [Halogeometricum borinquense]RYJ12863.1 methyltransferase domain-containing protein [Halogeometricum borinquense]
MPTRDHSSLAVEEYFLLWAARRSGILGALLDTAGSPEAVAREADVTEHAARVVVDALSDLGFVKQVGAEYEITNRALGFLAKRDVRSIGRLPHTLDMFDLWTDLPETMQTDDAPELPDEWTRNRLGAHAATDDATVRARVTAAVREAPNADCVLDICGASGAYATEFAARGYEAMLLDAPAVIDAVAPMLGHRDVRTVAANVPAFETDDQYGLVFAADVTSRYDPAANRTLLGHAFDVLEPGGTLVLVDTLRDGSPAAVRARIRALGVGHGDAYSAETYRTWLDEAGFSAVSVRPVPGDERTAVIARRPERAVD